MPRRLQTLPGVDPIAARATYAPPMEPFRIGRDCAAWLGLVLRQGGDGISRHVAYPNLCRQLTAF